MYDSRIVASSFLLFSYYYYSFILVRMFRISISMIETDNIQQVKIQNDVLTTFFDNYYENYYGITRV